MALGGSEPTQEIGDTEGFVKTLAGFTHKNETNPWQSYALVTPRWLLQSMSCSAYFCGIYSAGFLLCCSVDALYCSSVGLGASRCRVCAHGDLIVGEHAPLGALVSQGILCGV